MRTTTAVLLALVVAVVTEVGRFERPAARTVDPQAQQDWDAARARWAAGLRDYRFVWSTTAIAGQNRTEAPG